MKDRNAVVRRVLVRLRNHFASCGWEHGKALATMLVMTITPRPGIEHKLMVDEPLTPDQLPSKELLGLSCSVNVFFEDLENVVCSVFGYDPRTYGKLSASLALCQMAPKDSCYLGVYLISPEPEDSLKRIIGDYHTYLEPVLEQLKDISVFDLENYVPPSVGAWSWNMRRAAYYYLHKPKEDALRYFDKLEGEADRALDALGPEPTGERPIFFGDIAKAVEAGKRRSAAEAKRMASSLRKWTLKIE